MLLTVFENKSDIAETFSVDIMCYILNTNMITESVSDNILILERLWFLVGWVVLHNHIWVGFGCMLVNSMQKIYPWSFEENMLLYLHWRHLVTFKQIYMVRKWLAITAGNVFGIDSSQLKRSRFDFKRCNVKQKLSYLNTLCVALRFECFPKWFFFWVSVI